MVDPWEGSSKSMAAGPETEDEGIGSSEGNAEEEGAGPKNDPTSKTKPSAKGKLAKPGEGTDPEPIGRRNPARAATKFSAG